MLEKSRKIAKTKQLRAQVRGGVFSAENPIVAARFLMVAVSRNRLSEKMAGGRDDLLEIDLYGLQARNHPPLPLLQAEIVFAIHINSYWAFKSPVGLLH